MPKSGVHVWLPFRAMDSKSSHVDQVRDRFEAYRGKFGHLPTHVAFGPDVPEGIVNAFKSTGHLVIMRWPGVLGGEIWLGEVAGNGDVEA